MYARTGRSTRTLDQPRARRRSFGRPGGRAADGACFVRIRQLTSTGAPQAWALDAIPTIGLTADPDVPLDLPVPPEPPAALPDMAVIPRALLQSWCSELADRGATHLAVLTSERSPTYDVVTELAADRALRLLGLRRHRAARAHRRRLLRRPHLLLSSEVRGRSWCSPLPLPRGAAGRCW